MKATNWGDFTKKRLKRNTRLEPTGWEGEKAWKKKKLQGESELTRRIRIGTVPPQRDGGIAPGCNFSCDDKTQ